MDDLRTVLDNEEENKKKMRQKKELIRDNVPLRNEETKMMIRVKRERKKFNRRRGAHRKCG